MSNFVNLLDIVYPVGSVFISNTSISPADSIGGTWTQLEDGSFICQGTLEETGGANSYVLKMSQMPKHSHTVYWGSVKSDGNVDIYWGGKALAKAPNTTWLGNIYPGDENHPLKYAGGTTLLTTVLSTGRLISISAQPNYVLGGVA